MVGGNTIILDPAGEGNVAACPAHLAQEGEASMEDEVAGHLLLRHSKSFGY